MALTAVPPGVVTVIGPLLAPAGTTALMLVADCTVKVAALPLKATAVAPVNPEPLMVTRVPAGPLLGENELIAGAGAVVTLKLLVLRVAPYGVATEIGPLPAPVGTDAVIWVSDTTAKVAATPPNATEVAPVNAEPVIVTLVPTGPDVGENDVTAGAPGVVLVVPKSVALTAVPYGVMTSMVPPLDGAVMLTCLLDPTAKGTATPPTVTFVAPMKLSPETVTVVPDVPVVGVKDVIDGGGQLAGVDVIDDSVLPPG